jgi:hypothetical protein
MSIRIDKRPIFSYVRIISVCDLVRNVVQEWDILYFLQVNIYQ